VLREAGAAGTGTGPKAGPADAVTLIATGSEVALALDAAKLAEAGGLAARVVSMPAPQLFLAQDAEWRNAVLPPGGRRVSIEAGATDYWWRFTGESGLRIGVDRFGESAPLASLAGHFGFTPEQVVLRVMDWARSR
jgi:transketolase